MTNTDTPAALPTVRDVPAPLGVCDTCGGTPALPELAGRFHRCAPCHVRELLTDTAAAHLRELLAPALGAWADHWTAAGLPPEDLAELLGDASGADATDEQGQERRAELLRNLLEHHRPAPYTDTTPERLTVRLEDLPEVFRVKAVPGQVRPYIEHSYPGGEVRQHAPAPGLDLLTLELPDGSAVLLPIGQDGELSGDILARYAARVPARFRREVLEDWRPVRRHA